MLRFFSMILTASLTTATLSTVTTTFEDFGLPANSFLNDAGATGFFTSDGHEFNNNFNVGFDAWYGWSISDTTDTTTPGFTNQYSSITGGGADGSETYAVGFTFGDPAFANLGLDPNDPDYELTNPFHPSDTIIVLAEGTSPDSIQITNTTYTYLACRDGDPSGFNQAFSEGDYLLLDVRGYDSDGNEVDSISLLLADFTSSNPDDWYILNTWVSMDLTPLAGSSTLRFGIQSSQNDPTFGVKPPAYFAADNFVVTTSP
jgi:hypothetical protein